MFALLALLEKRKKLLLATACAAAVLAATGGTFRFNPLTLESIPLILANTQDFKKQLNFFLFNVNVVSSLQRQHGHQVLTNRSY